MDSDTILRMNHISKVFPGVRALNDVSFDLKKGEIHALIGENGAGKSTLMKVLGGVYQQDEGDIELHGEKAVFRTPADAIQSGVGVIYQEFNLVPFLSIAENIFLGKEIKGRGSIIDRKAMEEKSVEVLKTLGLTQIDASRKVSELSVAHQQMVEISKVLYNESKILVMDEPTAVLTGNETEALFEVMERLKASGVAIIYISHRLEEVQRMADRITVLRDGMFIREFDNTGRDVSKDEIVRLMVGRTLESYFPHREPYGSKDVVFEVDDLTVRGLFKHISFQLGKGEILGISGLVGAGRTEVAKAIFGALPTDGGEVRLEGKPLSIHNVRDAIKNQILLLPEDRKKEGLILGMTLADNICIPNSEKVSKAGIFQKDRKKEFVDAAFDSVSITPRLPNNKADSFSGGNQQKGIIAKWIARSPKVLILDEPTRGIDIGAKLEIYNLIVGLTAAGVSVIVISSEMMEIIGLCDRVLVMCDGRITGNYAREEMSQEKIMMCATTHLT